MSDETEIGSARTTHRARHPEGDAGEPSPLQTRAAFLKNRSWQFVISLNQRACERAQAQHGFNSETQAATAQEWAEKQNAILSFDETIEFLRHCDRRAPFFFYNSNTFAEMGRQIAAAVFSDLPNTRRREVTSAVAHYIEGVLDYEFMAQIVEELCVAAQFQPGNRVKTLRGSMSGTILRLMRDGRVLWRADSGAELMALPEGLLKEKRH